MQKFADESDGFIYISFGSQVKSSQIPLHYRNTLIKSLSKTGKRVIWKFETDVDGFPDFIKTIKWAPQRDILGIKTLKMIVFCPFNLL